jgi:hypothetical protein
MFTLNDEGYERLAKVIVLTAAETYRYTLLALKELYIPK